MLQLAQSAYRLLKFASQEFSDLWNWSPLFLLINSCNTEVKWYAVQCLGIYWSLSDTTRQVLKTSLFDDPEQGILVDARLRFHSWVGKIYSFRNRSIHQEDKIFENSCLFLPSKMECRSPGEHTLWVTDQDVGDEFVDICGTLLPRKRTAMRLNISQTSLTPLIAFLPHLLTLYILRHQRGV